MEQDKFKDIPAIALEQINGGDWLKDLGDYWTGIADGIKDAFGIRRK